MRHLGVKKSLRSYGYVHIFCPDGEPPGGEPLNLSQNIQPSWNSRRGTAALPEISVLT